MSKNRGEKTFTQSHLRAAAERAGIAAPTVESLLQALLKAETKSLTIICNEGVHPIPKDHLPGRVFAATVGNIPDESSEALQEAVAAACCEVAQLIKQEGPFDEIYVVPSGYGVVLQKLAEIVMQVTGRQATTLHFDRRTQEYWAIRLDLRHLISQI